MKYLIFEFDDYCPLGGMDDFVKAVETLEEAINYGRKLTSDNVEVYDRETLDMVWDNYNTIPVTCNHKNN